MTIKRLFFCGFAFLGLFAAFAFSDGLQLMLMSEPLAPYVGSFLTAVTSFAVFSVLCLLALLIIAAISKTSDWWAGRSSPSDRAWFVSNPATAPPA